MPEIADGSAILVSIVIALACAFLSSLFLFLRSRLREETIRIRDADSAAVLCAGEASIGGDLVFSLIKACHPATQLRLKMTSRGLRDAATHEMGEWANSFAEMYFLSMVVEKPVPTLLASTALQLPGNVIGSLSKQEGKGVGILIHFSTKLRTLRISRNQLGDSGIAHVASALRHNKCLTALYADANEIGDGGAIAIAKSLLHNTTLKCLDLSENGVGAEVHFHHEGESEGIGDAAATALAQVLQVNKSLETLWLSSCEITDDGAHALLTSLRESSVTDLDLRQNQIGDAAKKALQDLAQQRTPTLRIRL